MEAKAQFPREVRCLENFELFGGKGNRGKEGTGAAECTDGYLISVVEAHGWHGLRMLTQVSSASCQIFIEGLWLEETFRNRSSDSGSSASAQPQTAADSTAGQHRWTVASIKLHCTQQATARQKALQETNSGEVN